MIRRKTIEHKVPYKVKPNKTNPPLPHNKHKKEEKYYLAGPLPRFKNIKYKNEV